MIFSGGCGRSGLIGTVSGTEGGSSVLSGAIVAQEINRKTAQIAAIKVQYLFICMYIGVFINHIKGYAGNMKRIVSFFALASLVGAGFWACSADNTASTAAPPVEASIDKEASYSLGMILGLNLKADGLTPHIDEFIQGMKDSLYDSTARYSVENAQQIIQEAFLALAEKQENEFLVENSKKPGIQITGSGLQFEVIAPGNGPKPGFYDTVQVHYHGTFTNGEIFDSSYYGEPAIFALDEVITGWAEGLQLMNVGGRYHLFIPSALGYGPQGIPQQIPPYSTLIFEVELLDIIQK